MSISNVVVKQKYTGDTVTVAFPIPFAFIPGELSVIKVAVYDSVTKSPITPVPSYTLTPAGDTPTAVTFAVAPAATETIMVYRELPLTQVVDYIQNGSFLAESHEKGLDRIVLMVQQLADKGARSLQINMFDEGVVDVEIPPAIPDGVIGFNATGDALKVWSNGEFIGPAGEINSVSVAGELEYADPTPMSVTNIGTATNAQLEFVLRKGKTAEVAVGTVTSVGPTDPATVTNVGTSTNAVLDFEIPRGVDGASTSLITTSANLPDNGIGQDGDVWFVFDPLKPENGNVYQKNTGTYGLVGNIIGPPGGVNSFNSRTGAVVPAASDYDASMVDYNNSTSGLTATDLQGAVDELALSAVTTLGQAYLNSALPQIGLNATQGSLTIDDAAATVGTLFNIRNNAGTSSHFKVTSGGTAVGATTLNASAAFQVDSTTKGLLPPRMTTAQRDAISTPATGLQIFNTTTNKPNVYDGAKWSEVGSGGGINLITNPDGSSGTTGWDGRTYTAAARPSGTPTAGASLLTISSVAGGLSTAPTKLRLSKAVGNAQGQAREFIMDVPEGYQTEMLAIELLYKVTDTDFVAGSTSVDSSLIVYTAQSADGVTYSMTEPQGGFKLTSRGIPDRYKGWVQMNSDTTKLKLILYVADTTNAAWDLDFEACVSPSEYVAGTIITDEQTYTPSTGNAPTWSNAVFRYSRVGSKAIIVGHATASGTGGAGTFSIGIPANLVRNTASPDAVGSFHLFDTGVSFKIGTAYTSGNNIVFALDGAVNLLQGTELTDGDVIRFSIAVEIVGWSAGAQMSDGYDGRVVAAKASLSADITGASGSAALPFNTVAFDTTGSFNTSTNKFKVPTSGTYRISAHVRYTTLSAQAEVGIQLIIDGSVSDYIGTQTIGTSSLGIVSGSTLIYLKAGQEVQIGRYSSNGTYTVTSAFTSFEIEKLSGSAFMSPTATVAALYTGAPPTGTLNGSYNTVTFGTKVKDSHGAYSGGVYTIPSAGQYDIEAKLSILSTHATTTSNSSVAIFIDGSPYSIAIQYATIASSQNLYPAVNIKAVPLKAGQTVEVRSRTFGSSASFESLASVNQFSIVRSGGY